MAKKKQVEQPEGAETTSPESDEEDQAAPAKKAKSSEPVTVKFRDHEGKPVERTFSKEVHGDNFAELAEEFKANPNNRIIKE